MKKNSFSSKVNDVLEIKKKSDLAYDNLLKELYEEREKAKRLFENAIKLSEKRKEELSYINGIICELQGHKFDWREKESPFWDMVLSYEGKCEICGFVMVQNELPNKYGYSLKKNKKRHFRD